MNHEIADFVKSQFPGQLFIPVSGYAKLVGESYGGCRNRISDGSFDLKIIKRGTRNFVLVVDVINKLGQLVESGSESLPASQTTKNNDDEKAPRASKYGEAARARAAAARAARRAKRAALPEGEAV